MFDIDTNFSKKPVMISKIMLIAASTRPSESIMEYDKLVRSSQTDIDVVHDKESRINRWK